MIQIFAVWCILGPINYVDSTDFPKELQNKAILATVQFDTGGTGAIVKWRNGCVYVLTAEHVVAPLKSPNVSAFTIETYPNKSVSYRSGRVVAQSRNQDLALIEFDAEGAPPGILSICPPARVPKGRKLPSLSFGCGRGTPPTGQIDEVVDVKLLRRSATVPEVAFWETSQGQERGRSGGPLMDKQGFLIGVCSGRSNGKGYYVHIDEIHGFLKNNGYAAFVEMGDTKK